MADFVEMKCKKCDHVQRVFSRPAMEIKCNKCQSVLVIPKGGIANISE